MRKPRRLPAPKEYFRPTRARELREEADRLDHRRQDLARTETCAARIRASGAALLGFSAVAWAMGSPMPDVVLGLALLGAVLLALSALADRSVRQSRRAMQRASLDCRDEAASLEREHQARHGRRPPPG